MVFSPVFLALFWITTIAVAGFLKTYFRPVAGWHFFFVIVLVFFLEFAAMMAFVVAKSWR